MTEEEYEESRMALDEIIGQSVARTRECHKISLEELSDKIGLPPKQLQNCEEGTASLKAFELWNISTYLDVPIQSLYFYIAPDIPDDDTETLLEIAKLEKTLLCMFHQCKPKDMKTFVERVAEKTADLRCKFE